MKCTKYLMLVVLLLVPSFVIAETLTATFSWEGTTDPDSFAMWEITESGPLQHATTAGTNREMTWDTPEPLGTECHTFYMTAVKDNVPSQPSNPYAFCLPTEKPDMIIRPGNKIIFTIEAVPTEVTP